MDSDEAAKIIKEIALNYSEEKAKEVLHFNFDRLLNLVCEKHSPTPDFQCERCKEETKAVEAFRAMAAIIRISRGLQGR